jgi:hypothetical protein
MFRMWRLVAVNNDYDVILYYNIPSANVPADPQAACALYILYSRACREIITLFRSLIVSNSNCSITLVYQNGAYIHQLTG